MQDGDEFDYVRKAKQGKACCFPSAPSKWNQTIVLLRHSERRDRTDPGWKQTEEGKAWPHDTPITEAGITLAASVAEEISELHKEARFTVVACSPYQRCMETAAQVTKLLKIPVLIDQEIGEVWDTDLPGEPQPWRQPAELEKMAKDLGMRLMNPMVDGNIKLFGKKPNYPETLESAKTRFLVRVETYLDEGASNEQNFILVTHADAVAAALTLFERGNADVQEMHYCARVIATLKKGNNKGCEGQYAKAWDVQFKGAEVQMLEVDKNMEKYYEKQHLENVQEVGTGASTRKMGRTRTDQLFAASLRST